VIKKHIWLILFFSCLVLLVSSRLYLLPQTLYFWGDIGRDHELLIEMVQNKRPILLGPSNSQVPFNQSAWYFYLNMPVFLLSGYSAYTTAITGILLLVISLGISGSLVSRGYSQPKQLAGLSVLVLLITFQPLLVEQQRTTWNPAFALPFILLATVIFSKLLQRTKISFKLVTLFSFSLSFAVGMTYAVVPIVVLYILGAFWVLPRLQRFHFLGLLCVAFGTVFLPHILFDIRHDFLLTKQLFSFSQSESIQPLTEKLHRGVFNTLGLPEFSKSSLLPLVGVCIFLLVGVTRSQLKTKKELLLLLSILILSFITASLVVTEFNSHYSLGLSLLLLYILSRLPRIWQVSTGGLLLIVWFPLFTAQFTPAQLPHRSVADLERCAQLVCTENQQPMYVTAQAWHDFHSGYDYSFFFNKHGCYTRDIATHPNFSNTVAVVVDGAKFDQTTTDFYELSLFGPKKLEKTHQCTEKLSVHIFSRKY
jgi:hypothetical protein